MKQYLAIDIGGTYIKYSLMDPEYRVLHEGSTPTEKLPAGFLKQFMGIVETYMDQISGIAICMGGFIHPVTGENTDFSVGANFRAYRLKEEINRNYPVPVVLENDSNCAALGEMVRGAGRSFRDICMVTFGTGIGGAIIINRELYRGSHFKSGEVGFARVG
ncbi:ROK family protein, partial [Lacrimispora sp.]|uniref:ROK family protein n=1 Tax=Lacrimispora sp. TaxID=2719234 RepID=UPI0028B03A89